MKIYDADNQIMGRLAAVVAKELLKGETVSIVNSEKAVLSGNPKQKKEEYLHKYHRGDPIHGPFFPKSPERIMRRTIRGMLPWDKSRGRVAYKNLKTFIGIPEEMQGKTFEKVQIADASKLKTRFITLGDLAESMGAKKRWQ
jgi:large subunit ribosomal protein L13